jgi:hypothetical protein
MSVLHSKTNSGQVQIRFMFNGKKIVVTGKTLMDALRKVNEYHPVYL